MKLFDERGIACPKPVIDTKKYFENEENREAQVWVDNRPAVENLKKLAEQLNLEVEVQEKSDETYLVYLKKSDQFDRIIENTEMSKINLTEVSNKTTLFIPSNKLGNGDDELGAMLMKGMIYAISEANEKPERIILMNSGVKLATLDSQSCADLKRLKEEGTDIQVCGTCLQFYGLSDSLGVGEITNMYSIYEMLANASKVVRL